MHIPALFQIPGSDNCQVSTVFITPKHSQLICLLMVQLICLLTVQLICFLLVQLICFLLVQSRFVKSASICEKMASKATITYKTVLVKVQQYNVYVQRTMYFYNLKSRDIPPACLAAKAKHVGRFFIFLLRIPSHISLPSHPSIPATNPIH